MAKQTFTTGQVLTAAQMTSLQQTAMGGGSATAKTVSYVLVAADAGTVVQMSAAGATTITVNTALFAAGDSVQIMNIGAGVCTVTAGTATVNTSSTLALAQYDSGTLYFNSTSAALFFNTDAADAAAAGTLTGATLASNVLASSLTSFGTTPVIASPKISSTYTAKTAAYTFASGDEGNLFSMNNAATQQFNIPVDATFNFAIGTEINVFWITGAGQPTIGAVTPGTTTVISTGATSATPKLRAANSGATCKKLAANSWIVFGDLA